VTAPVEYDIWAPAESPWSAWAKPVLFAHLKNNPTSPFLTRHDISAKEITNWIGPASGTEALVLDVAGTTAIAAGIELARKGYRPIPLFNGCPGAGAVRDMEPLLDLLVMVSGDLKRTQMAPNAPPAFLLDTYRLEGVPTPGRFDNRWVTVPQDFPSGARLRGAGIQSVQVIRNKANDDLAHVLLRWQEAGLRLTVREPPYATGKPLVVSPPSRFRSFMYRMAVMAGLRRNSAGGFGSVVPDPTTAGGGFG
jgi:hypothetical protein